MLLGVHVPLVHIHPCPPTHSLAHAQGLEHTVIAPVKPGASPFLSCAHQLIPSVSTAFFLPSSHLSLPLCCSVGQLGKERERWVGSGGWTQERARERASGWCVRAAPPPRRFRGEEPFIQLLNERLSGRKHEHIDEEEDEWMNGAWPGYRTGESTQTTRTNNRILSLKKDSVMHSFILFQSLLLPQLCEVCALVKECRCEEQRGNDSVVSDVGERVV